MRLLIDCFFPLLVECSFLPVDDIGVRLMRSSSRSPTCLNSTTLGLLYPCPPLPGLKGLMGIYNGDHAKNCTPPSFVSRTSHLFSRRPVLKTLGAVNDSMLQADATGMPTTDAAIRMDLDKCVFSALCALRDAIH